MGIHDFICGKLSITEAKDREKNLQKCQLTGLTDRSNGRVAKKDTRDFKLHTSKGELGEYLGQRFQCK